MATEQRPLTRIGRLATRGRRSAVRRDGHPGGHTDDPGSPRVGMGSLVVVLFTAVCGLLAIWSREQPLVAVGRVMDNTRLVRVEFSLEDKTATAQRREDARARTPRFYVADAALLDEIVSSLENLPRTLASAESIEEVEPGIREQFGLTPASLAALRAEVVAGDSSPAWRAKVAAFAGELRTRPLLDGQSWQKATVEGLHTQIALVLPKGTLYVHRSSVVNLDASETLREEVGVMCREAGLVGPLRDVVVARTTRQPRPTFRPDDALTAKAQKEAADASPSVYTTSSVGQVIYGRGDVLTGQQQSLARAEMERFLSDAPAWQVWTRRVSLVAAVGAIALAITGYAALFVPRIRRNPARMAGAAGLLAGMLAAACFATAAQPAWTAVTVVLPTVFASIILCIAYDQRVALAYGVLHGVLTCLALDQGIGTMAVMLTGIGASIWQLREIRDRNTLLRMGIIAGFALAVATGLVSLVNRPINPQVLRETLTDAGLAGAGMLVVGAATLFILPLIERAFDITTGMTLIELRDPKHPLLRELQTRAPGTYNHALNVAAISEAAADAIGANGLLAYVGAIYHDVGKMTKPEYFVENQYGGANKHDRLTPAMSLLVVVGHVKDGMELARAYGLPRSVRHFIESHHGTTLVEYFYHRAKKAAQQKQAQSMAADLSDPDATYVPDEFEYRYPGPKPRTREAAILMIADACESASRTMGDPTPARLESLVRGLARKRLEDGQFDDCEATLRDIDRICDSIIRSLISIHHARVAYPGAEAPPRAAALPASPTNAPPTGEAQPLSGPAIEKRA